MRVIRGVMRLMLDLDRAPLAEFSIKGGRRIDVMAMAADGELWAIEVKSSREDYRTDRKWREYRAFCDRFFFAVGPAFPLDILPEGEGLIVADGFHGEVLRPAAHAALAPARRRALLLRFARTAALRAARLDDPLRSGL